MEAPNTKQDTEEALTTAGEGAPFPPRRVLTSEEIYGIVEQPAEGCPLINAAHDHLESAFRALRDYDKCDDVAELKDMIRYAEGELYELYGRRGKIEAIRTRLEEVRAWGKEWKNLAKSRLTPAEL